MKREGRQHGMVKTYPIISAPWGPRGPKPNGPSPVPAAGLFAKVPTKPTGHSKFTSKCGRPMCRECHLGPPTKSRDKVKGAHRLRSSSDVVSDYRLLTWRVVDARPGLKFSGFSASTVLDYLDAHDDDFIDGCDDDDDDECDATPVDESNCNVEENDTQEIIDGEDDDDNMSFCDVGFVWEQVEDGDEDWCLV